MDAVTRLAAAPRAAGKPLGVLDVRPALQRRRVEAGFTILGCGRDLSVLREGYIAGIAELRAPGGWAHGLLGY